jgi:parallel beta-helix repeat protein
MKKSVIIVAMLLAVFGWQSPARAAATCTPTGFVRDGIDMTAALIDPAATVAGDVDATGCNIGVYYDSNGAVDGANIHGANYFGVVVNGELNNVSVDVTNSNIHDIGESPLNGTQHGVGIYYRALGTGTAAGLISDNTLSHYQKGGIVTNGSVVATITGNTVTGEGPVTYIAQNGIQVGFGATAGVKRNTVTGHAYIQPIPCVNLSTCVTSAGILLYQSGHAVVVDNQLRRNQDGIDLVTTSNNEVSRNNIVGGIPGFGPSFPCCSFGDGIFADTDTANNLIKDNSVRDSVKYDCEDDSVGTNSPGVANIWKNNDGLTQNRPGLCRPGRDDSGEHRNDGRDGRYKPQESD